MLCGTIDNTVSVYYGTNLRTRLAPTNQPGQYACVLGVYVGKLQYRMIQTRDDTCIITSNNCFFVCQLQISFLLQVRVQENIT